MMGGGKGRRKRQLPAASGTSGEQVAQRLKEENLPVESGTATPGTIVDHSRLVSLRHHASLWLVPVALLVAALLPWPYGYYTLLRLAVFVISGWIAYEQWRHEDAISGWVVAFGATALLYNPVVPIHLNREIWSVLNIATATLFLGHLWALRRLVASELKGHRLVSARSLKRDVRGLKAVARMTRRRRLGGR